MQSLRPAVARRLLSEIKKLQTLEIGGIQFKINEDCLTEIHATITGPEETPFEGGQFDIKLEIGDDFPEKPPKGYFLTKIFHPNVSEAGAICLNTLSSDWNPDMGLDHLFLTIRCLFIEPNPASALNEEAGRLFLEKYEDYCARAKLMTQVHAIKTTTKPVTKDSQNQAKKRLKRL